MSIGARLKELRTSRKLTQKDLSELLNVSVDMIKSLEQNRASPSVENLTKISDFFECTTDYLLGRTDKANLLTVETWIDFHDYMESAARLIEIYDKARANRIRESLKYYPYEDIPIPAEKEMFIKKILETALK